jgi:hypothetical protein
VPERPQAERPDPGVLDALAGAELYRVVRAMPCPPVPREMHRKDERATALGARESNSDLTRTPTSLRLRVEDPQHAPDRGDSIGRDALSGNPREASLLAFLTSELR